MRSILPIIVRVLGEHYARELTGIRRVWSGTCGVHARADTTCGPVFVKTYPLRADFAYELLNIDVVRGLGHAGIPTIAPIPTTTGELIHRQTGLAMSVWQWTDAVPAGHLTQPQATAVGYTLARLHRTLDQMQLPTLPVNREHARTTPVEHITAAFDDLLQSATHRAEPGSATITMQLRRRLTVLRQLPELRAGLPRLRLARVHGDLASPNLLFHHDSLVAVIDPRVQLADRARELGRIAFDPHTVATTHAWPQIGLATVAGYLDAGGPLPAAEATASARLALLHALTSTYPLHDTLTRPKPPRLLAQQDRYWCQRSITVDRMLAALPQLEQQLLGLVHRAARHKPAISPNPCAQRAEPYATTIRP
jgi:Ser/Thr protein kinase RdoA (MazF antagonist)